MHMKRILHVRVLMKARLNGAAPESTGRICSESRRNSMRRCRLITLLLLSLRLILHVSLKAGSKRLTSTAARSWITGATFSPRLLDTLVKMSLGPPVSVLSTSMTRKTENLHRRVGSPDTSQQREAN